jgi:hypothetical protein
MKRLHADEVYTWGRSGGIGVKCLHAVEVCRGGQRVYMRT